MDNNDCNLPLYIANRSFYDRFPNSFSIPKSQDLDVSNPGIRIEKIGRDPRIPGFGILGLETLMTADLSLAMYLQSWSLVCFFLLSFTFYFLSGEQSSSKWHILYAVVCYTITREQCHIVCCQLSKYHSDQCTDLQRRLTCGCLHFTKLVSVHYVWCTEFPWFLKVLTSPWI